MKKKNIIPGIILLSVFVLGIITVNAQVFYTDNNIVRYTEKSVFDKGEDGWIYGFEIIYDKSSNNKYYIYDGYNLKYKESDEYYISYIDKETGEDLGKIKSQFATLSTSKEYRNEIQEINKFFNEKQYDKEIMLKDLNGLTITKIDKEYLVEMFNKAINSSMQENPGEYINSQFLTKATTPSTDENMPGDWQVICLQTYGNIYDVNIEFIDEDGNYALEKKETMKASSQLKAMANEVDNLEKSIISSQGIVQNGLTKENIVNNKDIDTLLKKLSDKLN